MVVGIFLGLCIYLLLNLENLGQSLQCCRLLLVLYVFFLVQRVWIRYDIVLAKQQIIYKIYYQNEQNILIILYKSKQQGTLLLQGLLHTVTRKSASITQIPIINTNYKIRSNDYITEK